MTETLAETTRKADTTCPECHKELVDEVCVNPDCKEAQLVASVAATRETAKATATTGVTEVTLVDPAASQRPRSYASSGRPD